jgi:hypothetical protein
LKSSMSFPIQSEIHRRARFMVRCAAVTLGAMIAAGCSHASPTPAPAPLGPIAPEARLLNDNSGGMRDSTRLVIRDAATLTTTWKQVTALQGNPSPMPTVDFTRDMVVVVAGGRMSPADEIHVDSAGVRRESTVGGKQQNILAILFTVTQGCRQFNRDAYPVEIVRLPRYAGEVRFIGKRERGPGCR